MCSPVLSPVLAKLYNKCLAESCFPPCWKPSPVVPVFKNDGERSETSKYRPISLLSIISKIFESFINDSLTKYVDITGLFPDLQYGFRATKLLSFNCHRDALLVAVEMHGFELPEEPSLYLLGLTFYSIYGLEAIYTVHCQGLFKGSGLPL